MSQFHDIAVKALETAQKLGAQGTRASISRSQNLEISWRQKKIENMSSAGESALTLALFVDGKYGIYQTSDLRTDSVQSFIEKGIAMTRLLEEDPARQLADPELYKDRPEIDLEKYDQNVVDFTPAQAIEKCKELEELCMKHDEFPIIDVNVGIESSISESYLAISNGFEGSSKSTYMGLSGDIIYADGERKPSGYDYTQCCFLNDMRSAQDIADKAAHYAKMKIGQKKLASGNRTLIFDRRAASSMINYFLSPLSGSSLIMKRSYFENKIGESFASALLDLHDEPLIKRGLGSRLYDSDGISAKSATFFDKGILKQYLLDVYSANKLGLKPTTGNFSNLVLTPGKRSLDEMIADVKNGIYVIGLMGGNMDEVRGDFSHGIVGVAIEKGKLTTPVSEMNITGNHTTLWKKLVEIGNDPNPETSKRIPSFRIDDVSVSGN